MAEWAESVVLFQYRNCFHCIIFGSMLAKVGSGIFYQFFALNYEAIEVYEELSLYDEEKWFLL